MSMNCSTNQKSSKEFTRKIKVSNLPGYDNSLLFMTKVFKMICTLKKALRPRIFVKYFFLFPQKNLSPEKTETN